MTFKEKYWHNLFQTGILVKAINGAWETISGLILLVVSNATLNSAYLFIFKDELITTRMIFTLNISRLST